MADKSRRTFIKTTSLGAAAIATGTVGCAAAAKEETKPAPSEGNGGAPIVISTWNHGIPANEAAMEVIQKGGKSIDAVEQGVRVPEADPKSASVGYGGRPDRDGNVTLDACIMDHNGNCGAVSFLKEIMHPISVARKVMDETPHVMLSGQGAQEFAVAQGFKRQNLLTEDSRNEWEKWKKESQYKPIINIENHDTIGLLALDKDGDLSGACTTSGLAWKMHGRVGDSPIIGAGMYCDNDYGAACATGMGEAVIKICGSFLVVELMRQGADPQQACEEAINRIAHKQDFKDIQVGFLALDKRGNFGAYALRPGFSYALHLDGKNEMFNSQHYSK